MLQVQNNRCTYTVHCKCPTYNVHCIRHEIYTYNVKGTISYAQFTMYNVQCSVYNNNVETPMYNLHCTIYIANVRSTMKEWTSYNFLREKYKKPFHVLLQMLSLHHYLLICLNGRQSGDYDNVIKFCVEKGCNHIWVQQFRLHWIQRIGRPKDRTLDVTVHGGNPVLL